MQTKTDTKVVIDSSPKDDLLRINFNIRCAIWAKLLLCVSNRHVSGTRVTRHATMPH